jgi:4-hydroxythreonine-4-phosphate dehydrogenase
MDNKHKPLILLTMGDPSGIGPEIVAMALNRAKIYKHARPIVVGSTAILERVVKSYELKLEVRSFENSDRTEFGPDVINVIDDYELDADKVVTGKIQKQSGQSSYNYIEKAVELIQKDEFDAMATAPIHKEALKMANIPEAGCTEILGRLTATSNPLTMFEVENLRIFFHSRHLSLKNAIAEVKKDKLIRMMESSIRALEAIGIKHRNFAVAGLNPHCSDGGLFGNEEIEEIAPAIKEMTAKGYNILGPIGADSVFHFANQNNWDGVLSLYHDQGHIAAKSIDFYRTVSVTLGLPFIRTSVDHGTAFDIAGKGQANPASMIEAILVAAKYARKYDPKTAEIS